MANAADNIIPRVIVPNTSNESGRASSIAEILNHWRAIKLIRVF
jgi:hypothetical protein